ncbi:MAG: hypothetical protein OFPII_01680 [Osedax symbiont Rs1]|nr:MAG: hypothetical protein OFPII_01680 [Osedax symbiont Rs1]
MIILRNLNRLIRSKLFMVTFVLFVIALSMKYFIFDFR